MKYYLRIEGVNLNNFVYDTQDLSTIRGSGLAILEAVNIFDSKTIDGFNLTKISTGASAGMFEFEVPNVSTFDQKAFCQAIRKELNSNGNVFRYATFVIDVLPFTDDLDSNFQLDREKVLAKNRWQQMQSPRFVFLPQNENKLVCEIDLISPAKNRKEPIKGENKFVSERVFQRREYGKTQKQIFVKNEIQEINKELKEEINKYFAYHLDSLTNNSAKGNLHHKMAVIYLDGNDFGKEQRTLDVEDLKNFDQLKTKFQREFLSSLVNKVISEEDWVDNDKQHYQMEILLWGGDEICLVVPAWKGWEVIEQFYHHRFEWNSKTLTHSIGIVFCHHNAPIRRVRKLAEDLAGLAKDKSRENNYFAYEILESFDHISKDLGEHRKSRCPQIEPININSMILDGNTIKEMYDDLIEIKTFFPKRKLTEIVINLLTKVENDSEKSERKIAVDSLIKSVEDSIGTENTTKLNCFVSHFGNNKYVALINALELWDYIEEAKHE